jgi:L-fuculose-phosphate aldolase
MVTRAAARPDPLAGLRAEVVWLGRRIVEAGLVVAAGGNVAGRAPGSQGCVVTPTARLLDELETDDLVTVRVADGSVVGDPAVKRPTTELALHLAVLRARPDVSFVVHAHPPTATLLHAIGVPIRAITTDHVTALRRRADVPYLTPGGPELAVAVARAVLDADVVLLRHHGCVVVGDTPLAVLSRATNLEAAAVASLHARTLGDRTTVCPPEHLEHLAAQEAEGIRYGS